MIVIKPIKELVETVRRVAREQPSYRPETASDLNEAASILEHLSTVVDKPPVAAPAPTPAMPAPTIKGWATDILEEEP